MNRLPLALKKFSSVLLVAVGVFVGLIGLFCTIGIALEWHRLGYLTESDRSGGLAYAGLIVTGALILWAGVVLLRRCGVKYTPAPLYDPLNTPQEAEAVPSQQHRPMNQLLEIWYRDSLPMILVRGLVVGSIAVAVIKYQGEAVSLHAVHSILVAPVGLTLMHLAVWTATRLLRWWRNNSPPPSSVHPPT